VGDKVWTEDADSRDYCKREGSNGFLRVTNVADQGPRGLSRPRADKEGREEKKKIPNACWRGGAVKRSKLKRKGEIGRERRLRVAHISIYFRKTKRGVFCASLLLKMNLGINFFVDSRFLVDFSTFSLVQARTSLYESKKVSGRFPDERLEQIPGSREVGNYHLTL